jgi:hypothetical protein
MEVAEGEIDIDFMLMTVLTMSSFVISSVSLQSS